jgi:hypothetical protein
VPAVKVGVRGVPCACAEEVSFNVIIENVLVVLAKHELVDKIVLVFLAYLGVAVYLLLERP